MLHSHAESEHTTISLVIKKYILIFLINLSLVHLKSLICLLPTTIDTFTIKMKGSSTDLAIKKDNIAWKYDREHIKNKNPSKQWIDLENGKSI